MNDEIITKQQGDIHNSIDKPKVCITLEDFNGGDGFAKMNLEYMSFRQVKDVEELVSSWNNQTDTICCNKMYIVNDWIISTENNLCHNICQIKEVTQSGYIAYTQDKEIIYISTYDALCNYRKWNISDMISGEVYVSYDNIFLYNCMDPFKIHYTYLFDGENVITDENNTPLFSSKVTPAFKEEIDLFWQKVNEYNNDRQALEQSDEMISEDINEPEEKYQSVFCYATENGEGVINALENFGGKNIHNYNGKKMSESSSYLDTIYYINSDNQIMMVVHKCEQIQMELWNVIIEKYSEIKPLKPEGFRCAIGESYYYIDSINRKFVVKKAVEGGYKRDRKRYNFRNYFMSLSRAKEVLEGLEKLILDKNEIL